MSKKAYYPVWGKIDLLRGDEEFFISKLNDRGSYLYRKLIPDLNHEVLIDGGEPIKGLKPTGKWLHEDDFGRRWITNHLVKRNIAVVELDGPLIARLVDLYDRRIGGQWRSTFNTCCSNNAMLLIKKYGWDEREARNMAYTICRGQITFEDAVSSKSE